MAKNSSGTTLIIVLLIGALLLLASFRAVLAIDPGFEPSGVLTASITLPAVSYTHLTLPTIYSV